MQYPCGVPNSTPIHRHIYNLLFNLTRAPQIGMVKDKSSPFTGGRTTRKALLSLPSLTKFNTFQCRDN